MGFFFTGFFFFFYKLQAPAYAPEVSRFCFHFCDRKILEDLTGKNLCGHVLRMGGVTVRADTVRVSSNSIVSRPSSFCVPV